MPPTCIHVKSWCLLAAAIAARTGKFAESGLLDFEREENKIQNSILDFVF